MWCINSNNKYSILRQYIKIYLFCLQISCQSTVTVALKYIHVFQILTHPSSTYAEKAFFQSSSPHFHSVHTQNLLNPNPPLSSSACTYYIDGPYGCLKAKISFVPIRQIQTLLSGHVWLYETSKAAKILRPRVLQACLFFTTVSYYLFC